MKKQTLLCGLAAACLVASASSDKLNFIKNGEIQASLRVDKIASISYTGDGTGFNTIVVDLKNGAQQSASIADFDAIEYFRLPASPLSIDVTPLLQGAELDIKTSDPNAFYRIHGCRAELLANEDPDEWADILIEEDIAYCHSVAVNTGLTLGDYTTKDVFQRGNVHREWFPDDYILGKVGIAMVAYTGEVKDGDIVVTSEPILLTFDTKEYVMYDLKYDISADLTSNTITVKVDAEEGDDIPFAIELYSKQDFENTSLSQLLYASTMQIQDLVYNKGAKWDDVCFRGHGEKTWYNRRMDDEWVAVVFGCDHGVQVSDASYKYFTIPAPVVADDCSFDVESTQLSPAEMQVRITPSNPETRYAAFLVTSDRLESKTPARYIAEQIYFYNNSHTITWSEDEYLFSGETTLTTHDGVIGGQYLQAGVDYTLLICGITPDGTRTTDIKELPIRTSADNEKNLTFDISFSDFDVSSGYTHFINVNITPSDENAKYVVNSLPVSNPVADLSIGSDEFMQSYVEIEGKYLNLSIGSQAKRLSLGPEYDFNSGETKYGKHLVFIFGYDGAVTSELYAYYVDSATGEVQPVSGSK